MPKLTSSLTDEQLLCIAAEYNLSAERLTDYHRQEECRRNRDIVLELYCWRTESPLATEEVLL